MTEVSIIIPVYNNPGGIKKILDSVLSQKVERDLYEVIVVDNNSTDRTRDVVRRYPVNLKVENEIQSSYAARNRGLKEAQGEYIAFIDSDCVPTETWLESGIEPLRNDKADMVAGGVEFLPKQVEDRSLAQLYDSLFNIQMQEAKNGRKAPTANLFCKCEVVDEVGLFSTQAISGEDIEWTTRATEEGFKLVYQPEALVYHPARSLKGLLKKNHRIGIGQVQRGRIPSVLGWARMFFPKPFSLIINKLNKYSYEKPYRILIQIILINWVCRISYAIGIGRQFLRKNITGKTR